MTASPEPSVAPGRSPSRSVARRSRPRRPRLPHRSPLRRPRSPRPPRPRRPTRSRRPPLPPRPARSATRPPARHVDGVRRYHLGHARSGDADHHHPNATPVTGTATPAPPPIHSGQTSGIAPDGPRANPAIELPTVLANGDPTPAPRPPVDPTPELERLERTGYADYAARSASSMRSTGASWRPKSWPARRANGATRRPRTPPTPLSANATTSASGPPSGPPWRARPSNGRSSSATASTRSAKAAIGRRSSEHLGHVLAAHQRRRRRPRPRRRSRPARPRR